jgi:hypothetical protein
MVASCSHRCISSLRDAASFLLGVEVDIIGPTVTVEVVDKRIRGEDGSDTAVMDTAVRPFRVAGVVVRVWAKLELSTWCKSPKIGWRRWERRPGIRGVSEVRGECFDFGGAKRVTEPVGKAGLFLHCTRRAASRACWTAGSKMAARIPIIPMTTRTSTSVNPLLGGTRSFDICLS